MSLVAHNPAYRRAWMFQRNIRKIPPWKMAQILSVVYMQLETETWSGNRAVQDSFNRTLEALELKSKGEPFDSNNGGARTYFSQLESLGLLFTRDDRSTWLTIAGEDLANGRYSPSEILRKQILNYQYPSVYSKSRNVKIHPGIKIKPFVFILKLLSDPEILHLTDSELVVPVVYGHNTRCFALCKEKILQLRSGADLMSVIDIPEHDLYTPRTARNGRTHAAALADFKNIANTCKNYMEACSLVVSEQLAGSRVKCIYKNTALKHEISAAIASENSFIDADRGDESFQRKYGNWRGMRDGRILTRNSSAGSSAGEPIIRALFAEYAGNNLVTSVTDEFLDIAAGYGFDRNTVRSTVEPYLANSLSLFEQHFMSLASGGRSTASDFEKAVARLFEERLGYVSVHTGQRHRAGRVGGFSDIFIKERSGRFCAIVDTKASPAYDISASEYHTMVNSYIPSVSQLAEYSGENIGFCAYIAGGFNPGVESSMGRYTSESGHRFSAIRAYDFLQICREPLPVAKQEAVTDVFRLGRLLNASDFDAVIERGTGA